MKKITLLLLFIASGLYAQQDDSWANDLNTNKESGSSIFKQEAGNKSVEILFNPAGIFRENGGDIFNLSQGGTIKYRSFSTDDSAFRMAIGVQYNSLSLITQQENDDMDRKELRDYYRIMGITFSPGFEKHFAGSNKLSPYVGWQANIGFYRTSYEHQYQSGNDVESVTYINDDNDGLGLGYFRLGISLLSGVDWYFTKKLYLGAELGVGVSYDMLAKSKITDSGDSDNDEEYSNGSMFNLSTSIIKGGIRLGWTF